MDRPLWTALQPKGWAGGRMGSKAKRQKTHFLPLWVDVRMPGITFYPKIDPFFFRRNMAILERFSSVFFIGCATRFFSRTTLRQRMSFWTIFVCDPIRNNFSSRIWLVLPRFYIFIFGSDFENFDKMIF